MTKGLFCILFVMVLFAVGCGDDASGTNEDSDSGNTADTSDTSDSGDDVQDSDIAPWQDGDLAAFYVSPSEFSAAPDPMDGGAAMRNGGVSVVVMNVPLVPQTAYEVVSVVTNNTLELLIRYRPDLNDLSTENPRILRVFVPTEAAIETVSIHQYNKVPWSEETSFTDLIDLPIEPDGDCAAYSSCEDGDVCLPVDPDGEISHDCVQADACSAAACYWSDELTWMNANL